MSEEPQVVTEECLDEKLRKVARDIIAVTVENDLKWSASWNQLNDENKAWVYDLIGTQLMDFALNALKITFTTLEDVLAKKAQS